MPINVVCDECGKKYRLADKFAGRSIPCKECGADLDVPDEDGGPFVSDGPARRSQSGGGKRKKSGGMGVWPILLGIAAVALLVVGLAVWGVVSSLKPRTQPGNGGFTPGGVAVNPHPNPVFPGQGQNTTPFPQPIPGNTQPEKSRFEQPVVVNPQPNNGNNTGRPVNNNRPTVNSKPNPRVGIGFGNVVGITDQLSRMSMGIRSAADEFESLKQEPDALPPDIWTVSADPPKETLVFEPERKTVKIKVPLEGKRMSNSAIVFPPVPSPFVTVGANQKKGDVREVWNLCTGKKVSSIRDLNVETADCALSPDGKYFAGVMKADVGSGSLIGVYDIEQEQVIGNLESAEWSSRLAIAFPQPDLLIAMDTSGDRTITAWQIPSGDQLYQIKLGWKSWHEFPPVISPGGKYLAWTFREHIAEMVAIYDLEDGQLVGKMSLPEYDVVGRLTLHGLAFSHDGKEVAVIVDSWYCSKILIYSMSNGEIVDHMTFSKKLQETVTGDNAPWGKFNPLVFFPGNQRLLAFEHGVVDRSVGELVWGVPRSGVDFAGKRWPIDETHLTVIDVTKDTASVLVLSLPEEKIKQSAQRIADRKGVKKEGVPSTIGRVDATNSVDERQVRFLAPEATTEWKLSPTAAAAPESGPTRAIGLKLGSGHLQEFAVSSGGTPKAALLRGPEANFWKRIPKGNIEPSTLNTHRSFGIKDDDGDGLNNRLRSGRGSGRSRSWLDLFDLGTGKHERQIRLAYDADLVGFSPDGSRALLWAAIKRDRLDLYDMTDGTLVASWDVDVTAGGGQHLVGAALVDQQRVCTLNAAGLLTLWRIDTANGSSQVVRVFEVLNASQPAVSASGQLIGYSDGEKYLVIDTAAGEIRGQIPDVGTVHGAAFHPSGQKLALLSEHKGGYYLFTVDLKSGVVQAPFPVPVLTPFLQWCGDQYILLDNKKLVDVEQKVVAWTYELDKGDHLPYGADGRHWFVVGKGQNQQTPTLASVQLPTADAAAQLKGTQLQPEFVLQPGGKCSLSIQLGAYANLTEDARKAATAALAKNNVTVEPNQPVTLSITLTETVGETRSHDFIPFGRGQNQTVSITDKSASCKFQFQTSSGLAWESTQYAGTSTGWVTTQGNQSISQAVEQNYQGSVKYIVNSPQLPPFVFTPKAANGIGSTDLATAAR